MRARAWWTSLCLIAAAVACGDQPTEVVPEREDVKAIAVPGGMAAATSSTEDGLVITTDKDDYQPGDTVHLTGSGWPADDTLDIVLEDEPATHDPHQWSVGTDAGGAFHDSTYVVDAGDLDVTFTLTATSRSTGRSLAVVFTDANISNDMSVDPGSLAVVRGDAAVYTVTVNFGGNSTPCNAPLSISGLPTGAAGTFNPTSVTGATGATATSTLTITTTASGPNTTPSGTSTFTVQAATGTGCTGSARTATGVLVVSGPATKLAFGVQPANRQATQILPSVTVRVLDAANNLVAASTASIALAIGNNPGGGTLSGTATLNAVAGVATFPGLSIDKIGTGYTLSATSSGLTGITSNAFNITLGPPAQLVFTTQPSGGTPNTAFPGQPVVAVRDAGGNTITTGTGSTATIDLAIVAGTGTAGAVLACTPSNSRAAVAGIAAFSGCKIDLAGSGYRLRASSTISGNTFTVDSDPFDVTVTNQPPTADAGGPYTVAEGTELTLAPTVNDPDGDGLTYHWVVVTTGIDASGACTFDDDSQKNAKFTCTDDSNGGTFTLTLEVNDGTAPTVSANANLTVTNANPTANAGGPYSGDEGEAIQLGGSGDDPGNNDDPQLGYQWTALATGIDAGGACTFDNAASKNAKVTCTDDGSFKVSLVVSDDDGGTSVASEANLTVDNVAPTANAGGPYGGDEGEAIQLSGAGDDAGDNDDPHLTYKWTTVTTGIDPGGACTFDVDTSKDAKVTCTDDGAFKVRLVVKDDDGGTSVASEANLNITNAGPVADAGGPYNGNEGSPVSLNGTVTDAGANDTHTWLWKYVAGAGLDGGTCSFLNEDAQDTQITCTDDGTVELTLKVTDDDGAESEDTATLTLANVDPVANAGGSYTGSEGSPVSLNGSVTDAGTNDTHTWSWQYVGTTVDPGATCLISNPVAEDPTITCTDDGTVQLTLTVTDDDGGSDSDQATLTLANVNPVATAGGPYGGAEGAAIQLTGTATDAGTNDALTRHWSYAAVSGVDAGATCSFSPNAAALSPTVSCTDDGTFKLTLTVNDDDGGTGSAEATFAVTNANPVADAGGPYSGTEGGTIALTGGKSDAGSNDTHTYLWSYAPGAGVDAGASCSFTTSAAALNTSVKCTDDGTYQVTLAVTDDDGGVGTSTVNLALSNVDPAIASPLTRPDGSPLPTTIIVAGTLDIRTTFGDAGSNDTHTGAIECDVGAGYSALGAVTSPFDGGCTFGTIGPKTISVKVTDDDGGVHVAVHTLTVKYNFAGFFAPVDRPNTMNVSKAGQAIPLKWRLTDANGAPVSNLAAVTVQAVNLGCSLGDTTDQIEEYAAGNSGLQNQGNGYYQFNWKTPANYVGSCKSINLVFASGGLSYTEGPHAYFTFKK